jgi:hypothetical protein
MSLAPNRYGLPAAHLQSAASSSRCVTFWDHWIFWIHSKETVFLKRRNLILDSYIHISLGTQYLSHGLMFITLCERQRKGRDQRALLENFYGAKEDRQLPLDGGRYPLGSGF